MTRYFGLVGYNLGTQETRPGVWEEVILEKNYSGNVLNPARQASENEAGINGEISVSSTIEIVADEFANDNFFAIRYCNWKGKNWNVEAVTPRHPRLVLRLGALYNGPTPAPVTP